MKSHEPQRARRRDSNTDGLRFEKREGSARPTDTTHRKHLMPNRLAHESSPYLLQHKDNPVDWHPWADEALARAKAEQKPIFLSIGYSACHWCHVMEHESFESDSIAAQLNENFVCIKVDREERPDLDQIYMQAVQMMTGRGGWPMSAFLTPELQPFFGGTYWPPKRKHGMPGFDEVLVAVLDAWENRREQAIEQAGVLTERISTNMSSAADGETPIDMTLLDQASRQLISQFDHTYGGFGEAPKFPHSMAIQFLLHMWTRDRERNADLLEAATKTLDCMADGGIYDHLAGGFARYSVDARWLVPHFEKMLYDNALLLDAYVDAFTATDNPRYLVVAEEICNYMLKYMTDDARGFHSTEDADSEGEEGKFYVWTIDEVKEVLGDELAEKFCYVFDITEHGNFEGKNIPNLSKTLEQCASIKSWDADELRQQMTEAKQKLLAVRDQRVRPGKDDKILTSWNGLMIHSMARAAVVLENETFLRASIAAAEFVLGSLRKENGRMLHTWRHGTAKLDAYLDDYANLANAMITLYESTFEDRWLDEAVSLADMILKHFGDKEEGGLFYTADDHETLIARMKDFQDNAVPSGNGMAATLLQRLGHLCNRDDYLEAAHAIIQVAIPMMRQYPIAVGQLLIAADMKLGPIKQCVIAEGAPEFTKQLRKTHLPRVVLAAPGESSHLQSLVAGKTQSGSQATLYVCDNFTCQTPVEGDSIAEAIESLAKS